jgi:NAD(P)-dependent dehydrogenase (short-subunit alcohol dehydrogenase family)
MPSALVTGGSSGIGLAIARMLRDEGYDLTLAARTVERLEEAAGSLGATAIPVDVRSEEECARLVAAHLETHGGLDVLVNSAGVGIAGRIGDTSTKQFDLQQSVNLRSAFLVTREALPALRESRGYVINLASIAGTIATPGLATYGAAKAALIALTRSLVREESDNGVRATALCPGFVDTPMTEFVREHVPPEEMIRTSDVAEAVRYLLKTSPKCVVPEIVFQRPGEAL